MKKLIIILAAAALFAACSKKQTPAPAPLTPQTATIKDITGNWLATADSTTTTTNGQSTITVSSNSNGTHFQFNADATGLIGTSSAISQQFTYTVKAGTVFIHVLPDANNGAQDISVNIVVITANKLVLRINNSSSTDDIAFVKE